MKPGFVSTIYERAGVLGFVPPFRITSGHPLLPHHVEDADGHIVAADEDFALLDRFKDGLRHIPQPPEPRP